MSNHDTRLKKLEAKHAPKAPFVCRVVIYNKEGIAMPGSSADVIGKTREQIATMDNDNTVILNVKPASEIVNIYIPDNGRG